MAVATQKMIYVQHISKFAVGDPDIIDVKTTGSSKLLIVGLREGETTLTVWHDHDKKRFYNTKVVPNKAGKDKSESKSEK
jgi:Flp pilus assembly secretin CpaC